jgi:PadR family transcriptional regulator PadR
MPRRPHSSPQARLVLETLAARLGTWCYGMELSRLTMLKSGTLYPLLIRLAADGLLETEWAPPDRPGRPPRHLYRITASGRALLSTWPLPPDIKATVIKPAASA